MPLDRAATLWLPHGRPRRAGFVAVAPMAIALIVQVTPELSAAQPSPARLVPRDPPVWLTEPGLALGLRAGSPPARVLRWTWAAAEPRVGRSLAACVQRRGDPLACQAGAPTHGRVRYDGVVPGVALTVENRGHAAVYRFDVAPHSDARNIRMRYLGTDGLAVEDGGRALRMRAGGWALRESGLFCYQEISGSRKEVPCRYRIAVGADGAHEVALDLGAYDSSRRLVVDPTIAWSSYLGGGGDDQGNGIAVDSSSNVYVVGTTASADLPSAGGFDTSIGGSGDAFVAKVDLGASGLVWSSYLGGDADDEGNGVAVDLGGNVYVAGTTYSSDFPSTGGFDTGLDGAVDAFVAKVDAAGSTLVWSSYLGGGGNDRGRGVALDGTGNIYVVGNTASSDFPSTGGFDTSPGGALDAFVTKVGPTGNLVWSSYLGGAGDDFGSSAAVDSMGDLYLTGVTYSVNFPAAGGFDASLGGTGDAFVAKVDSTGPSLAWSSYLGGGGFDQGRAVAVDASGNVYLTGYAASTDFPTMGGFDTTSDVAGDAFVTKVDAAGSTLAWSSYLGGSDYEEGGFGIAVDSGGNVYVTGGTFSSDFPAVGGFDTSYDPGGEAFLTKVDAAGSSLAWSSYLGGGDGDNGNGVAVDGSDNVYVTGYTFSSDFPSLGGFDTSFGGTVDAWVTQILNSCGNATCEGGETPCNCPGDCGADSCGSGCCGPTEDSCSCQADCGSTCDDGCCNGSEDACTCPGDCAAACGDGCCTGTENCTGCPSDCGSCPAEPSPDMTPDMTPDAGGAEQVADGSQEDSGSEPGSPSDDGCGCAVGQVPRERAVSLFALWLCLGAFGRRLRARFR